MKKGFFILSIIFFASIFFINSSFFVNATSPINALKEERTAEEILFKLQNSASLNVENEEIYNYLELLYTENTLFFNYKINELETLLQTYRENILKKAKRIAQDNDHKKAVELLQSKASLFKDKTIINSLITYYSKFFVQDGLFYYEEEPIILSIGKLIAYPDQAFSETNISSLEDNLTTTEFQNLLKQLYNENYVLINLDEFINLDQEIPTRKDLHLPPNKKPIVLIFNDSNYNHTQGFIEKYIVDPQDEIACYNSKETEKNIISYNTDYIPTLENFILTNKDFSFNNARGIICFNENDTILGYNISKQNPNQTQEILNLKKVTSKLKEKGYTFAYNGDLSNLSLEELENKKDLFNNLFKQIFGDINCLFCKNSTNNQIKSTILSDLNIKIVLDTIKTNICVFKNNFVVVPTNNLTFSKIFSKNIPIAELNFEEIYDHINRKNYNF